MNTVESHQRKKLWKGYVRLGIINWSFHKIWAMEILPLLEFDQWASSGQGHPKHEWQQLLDCKMDRNNKLKCNVHFKAAFSLKKEEKNQGNDNWWQRSLPVISEHDLELFSRWIVRRLSDSANLEEGQVGLWPVCLKSKAWDFLIF